MRSLLGRVFLGMCVSLGLLWFVFRQINWEHVRSRLELIDGYWILLFVGAEFLMQACRVVRWDLLTRSFAPVSYFTQIRIYFLGLAFLVLLPVRLGEFARPYFLLKETGASFSQSMGAVVLERILDGLSVCLIFFVTTSLVADQYLVPSTVSFGSYVALVFFSSLFILLVAAVIWREQFFGVIKKLGEKLFPGLTEKVLSLLRLFLDGCGALPNLWSLVLVAMLTWISWAFQALGYYAIMCGFGLDLPIAAGFVVICVIVFGLMVPAGPGFLGSFQGAILVGLTMFGVGSQDAVAFGLVVYPLSLLMLMAVSLPLIATSTFRLKDIVLGEQNEDVQAKSR